MSSVARNLELVLLQHLRRLSPADRQAAIEVLERHAANLKAGVNVD